MEVKLMPKEGNSPWQEAIMTEIISCKGWWNESPIATIQLTKSGSIVSMHIEGLTHAEAPKAADVGKFTNTCPAGLGFLVKLPAKFCPDRMRICDIRLVGCTRHAGQICIQRNGQIIISSHLSQKISPQGIVTPGTITRKFERICRADPHGFAGFSCEYVAKTADYVPSKDEMDNLRELIGLSGAKIAALESLVREQGAIIARLQLESRIPKYGILDASKIPPEGQVEGVASEPGAPD